MQKSGFGWLLISYLEKCKNFNTIHMVYNACMIKEVQPFSEDKQVAFKYHSWFIEITSHSQVGWTIIKHISSNKVKLTLNPSFNVNLK